MGKVSTWIRLNPVAGVVLGTTLGLVAASGGLLYGERAVVRLFVVPQRVQVEDVTLSSGSDSSALKTTRLVASVTETQTVTSSQVTISATVATGRVTFTCSPMSLCPNGYTVPAGTVVESTTGLQYRTSSAVSFPSCAPSSPVGISALTSGAAGNAGAGAVVYGSLPSYIHVTNPWPIVGGSDARTVPMVEQPDVDAAVKTLTARATSDLEAQLQAKAGGLSYVATGAPSFVTGGDFQVGQQTPTFTVKVTGTLDAIAFSENRARDLLRRALARHLPAGYQLAPKQIDAAYSTTGGTVLGTAAGYMIPTVDVRALAVGVRGQSVTRANEVLRHASVGGAAQIQITPAGMPTLPMIADHITVLVVVQA